MKPQVSVILCTYNQREWIRDAVESVLAQTYHRCELVVVDNGSNDGTSEVLRRYANHPRVKLLLEEENNNVTQRLNSAIRWSQGEFISILYGDDYYLCDKIERQVARFMTLGKEYGVVHGPGIRLHVRDGRQTLDPCIPTSGWVLNELLLKHSAGFVNPIAPLMRRECFERYPYREDLFVEGESINLRFAMTFKYDYLDMPLVVMREHESNLGKAIAGNLARLMVVLDLLKAEPEFPHASSGAVEVFRSRVLRDAGWQGVRRMEDRRWARSCYVRAIRTRWVQALHPRTIAGLVLLLGAPTGTLAALNRFGNRLRGLSPMATQMVASSVAEGDPATR